MTSDPPQDPPASPPPSEGRSTPHEDALIDDGSTAERSQHPDAAGTSLSGGALPARIGQYRILRIVGQGGMGVVYEAQQDRPSRVVALKVVRGGGLSASRLRRFEHESQVLGRLQHPGIAQIYEAGTVADEHGNAIPYFAMELIRGVDLRRYAASRNLGTRERLDLIAKICDAVSHAHQRGVIHRDLKPSNILVEESGQPRVLDFGIARATDSDVQQTTMHTDIGQIIGTLPYMSPEQVGGDTNNLDTRSDVYALGVIAYELLAGRLPYQVDKRIIHEAVRIIQEEEPTPLSSINRALRGDVETIVGKALEKEKARRYASADAFASDIRRYLKNEPIAARPASAWYQARKFAQRHKATVTGLAAAFVLLAVGLVVTTQQAARARAERDRAESVVAFMDEMLQGVGPSVARGRDSTMLKEMMDQAAARIEKGDLTNVPDAELRLRGTIGDIYRELEAFPAAAKMLEPAAPLARSLRLGDSKETADALQTLGVLYKDQNKFDEGEPLLRESLVMTKRLFPGDSQELAKAQGALANLLADRGHLKEAEPLARESLAMFRRVFRGDHTRLATAINDLGNTLHDMGDMVGAEPLYREAVAMHRRLFQGDHPETGTSLNNLAVLLKDKGELEEAEATFKEALAMNRRLLPKDHLHVAGGINNLASLLEQRGKMAEAEPLYRESLSMRRRLFPGDHSSVAGALNNLALVLEKSGDFRGAEPLFRESLAMRQRIYKGDHRSIALDLNNLALLLRDKGDLVPALATAADAIAMFERTQGKDYWLTGYAHMGRSKTFIKLKRFEDAEKDLIEAERVMGAPKGVPAGRYQTCLVALAEFYEEWSKANPRGGHAARAAEWKAKASTHAAAEPK